MNAIPKALLSATAAFAVIALAAPPASADFFGPSKPKINCKKKKNKNKPQCKKKYRDMSVDEIYNAAYWLSQEGRYRKALDILAYAETANDKRIWNAIGLATRKLGDIDGALPYYARALQLDPNFTLARSYLGEAYLSKGDLAGARGQLREIAVRCGTVCDGYAQLAGHIADYEATSSVGG